MELTYDYSVENRLKAMHDKKDLLVTMAYDGDGNRIFQLNYNLYMDDDWKGNSGNGNGNNKDNSGSGNNGNSSGNGTGSKGLLGSFLRLFTGDSEEAGGSADTSTTSNASPESKGNKGNKDKDKGNDGNDKNNGKGNGNGNSGNNGNGNSGNNGNGNSGNNGNASTGGSNDNNGNANGNTNNTGGSQNQSGILFPIDGEVSKLESELIGMIKTTGKEKNYELVEYVNDVNREHTEVLMELNINGIMDTAYSYGNERLTNERFTGWTGYYTYDPRGSVTGVTDDTGMIWQSYRYNANGDMTFGKPQYNNVYSYNAESYNPNMESQYLRARYYNVPNGNFMTEDSYLGNITDPLTLNRYNYVKSSPLNYIDPSGHAAWDYDYVTGNYDFDPTENQLPNFENVLRNYTPTQYVQNVDSFIKGMLNWVQGVGKELTCELGTELAADLIDVLLGFGYSFIDNLLLQPHEWWQTHIQGYMPETVEQWRANVEAFVIDNGVNNESAFYIGQIIGDAYQTALAFKNLPLLFKNLLSAVEALGTAFSTAIQGLHTGGGTLAGAGGGTYEVTSEAVISIGQTLGLAREEVLELIGAIGVAGAGLLYAVGKVTGASDDIRKLGESLSKGESNSYSYKNGTYEKAEYHSGQTTGRKNPAPKDGQFALDNSVSIGENTSRRIGLDKNGDFVILDETSPGVFHGHIRGWSSNGNIQGLSQEMKNALYNAGYIKSPKGSGYKLTDYAKSLIEN